MKLLGMQYHKLNRPLVYPSNRFWRDSTQTKNQTSTFQIGDSLIYTIERKNEIVDININYPDKNK